MMIIITTETGTTRDKATIATAGTTTVSVHTTIVITVGIATRTVRTITISTTITILITAGIVTGTVMPTITTITTIETTVAATAAMAGMIIAITTTTEIITAGRPTITDSMVGTKWIIGIQQHEATQDSLNGKRTGGEASLIGRYR